MHVEGWGGCGRVHWLARGEQVRLLEHLQWQVMYTAVGLDSNVSCYCVHTHAHAGEGWRHHYHASRSLVQKYIQMNIFMNVSILCELFRH